MGDSEESLVSKTVQFGVAKPSRFSSSSSSKSSDSKSEAASSISEREAQERLRQELEHFEYIIRMSLSRLMACISTIVVQQALQEITILRKLNDMPKLDVQMNFVPKEERYNMAGFDLEALINTSDEFLAFKKLQKDIGWTENVLNAVVENLNKNFYYDNLQKILCDDQRTKDEEQTVLESKKFNNRELKKLRYFLNNERRELTKMIYNITQKLGNCKDQLNDSIVENKIKVAYVQEWQKSRHEQNQMLLQNKEKKLSALINNVNTETDKENRIHEEQWLYLETSIEEYKADIELWMDKYDKDLEKKEHDVQSLKIDLDNKREQYLHQLEEYNSRQQFIDEYKAYKIQKEKETKELERRYNAAIKIQSWWRGVMFRKGLGPYRKKKGKGKGKGANGKNGKKKK